MVVEFLVQLSAASGPIILAVMGVVVSLNPPDRSGVIHKIWAGAFIAIGAVSAFSIFFELRGTDQILGQIWEHVRETKPATVQEGRHLDSGQKAIMKTTLKLGIDEHYDFQINSAPSCDECELFAEELREFFNTIPGWQTTGGPLIFPAPHLRGLKIVCREQEKNLPIVKRVEQAFADAGLPLEQSSEDVQAGTFIVLVARIGK
jgi:hypothetical protein